MNNKNALKYPIKFLLLISLCLLQSCGEYKRVDALMEELCKKDGGLTIYEKVYLPSAQVKSNGEPTFFERWDRSAGGYKFVSKVETIKADTPRLTKDIFMVIRESDGKVLAVRVSYLRKGGEVLFTTGPDKFKRCPELKNDNLSIFSVFFKKDSKGE